MDSDKSIAANFSVSTDTWIKIDSHDPLVTIAGSGYDSYTDAPFAYMNTWYPIWDGSASFSFTGNKVRFYAVTSQWNGDASIKIDGLTVGTASTYSSGTVQEEIGDVLVWESDILSNDSHSLEVIAVDEIGVDAFVYSPDATDIVVPDENNHSDLTIYPNPAKDVIYLVITGFEGQAEVNIINLNGSEIYSNKFEVTNDLVAEIPASKLNTGLYLLRVIRDNFTKTKRFNIIK
jgi:hypothetical protein